jgi:membrane-bound metal-dependent hydrolase YbcI (DUF457 family)
MDSRPWIVEALSISSPPKTSEPMPFTPFHFGPGLALAGASRWIDFWAFCAANVLIDLESGWHLWRHEFPVHRFFHSFLGATLVILPAAMLALLATRIARRAGLARGPRPKASLAGAIIGAAAGAWSHVLLDAIMHDDMKPLAPWSAANPLLGLLSLEQLHNACLVAGAAGVVLLGIRVVTERRSASHRER